MPCLIHEHSDIFAWFAGGRRQEQDRHRNDQRTPGAAGGSGGGACGRRALWEQPKWLTSPQRGSRQCCCAASQHFCLPRVPAVKTRLSLVSNSWTQDFRKKVQNKERKTCFQTFLFCTCRIRTVLNKLQFQNGCFYLLRLPVLITKQTEASEDELSPGSSAALSFKDRKWLMCHFRLVTLISNLIWQPPAWTVPLIADRVWLPDRVYGFSFTKRQKKAASPHWWI